MIENKLLINTYTLNDLNLGKQLMKSGINMIITDEVEKMLDLRKEIAHEA